MPLSGKLRYRVDPLDFGDRDAYKKDIRPLMLPAPQTLSPTSGRVFNLKMIAAAAARSPVRRGGALLLVKLSGIYGKECG